MAKTFVLSDESVNELGFWVKTSGIELTQFIKNPIMFWMHNRWKNSKDGILPIGHWENIRVQGEQLLADAVFDADEFSQSIAAKVESCTIRMASAGLMDKEWNEDQKTWKPGQVLPTLMKSLMKEASLCDIGANDNALAFYDENDNLITLSVDTIKMKIPFLNSNPKTMKKVINLFSDLGESATEDQVAEKVIELQSSLKVLQDKIAGFETQRLTALKAEATTLIDAAVKDGRIDAGAKEHYIKLFDSNHDATKSALAALRPHKSVSGSLADANPPSDELVKLSWDELDKANKLVKLKSENPDLYKSKFKEKFGTEPKA